MLRRFFDSNKFFKEQAQQFEEKTILYLFRNLRYAEYHAMETVFHFGDEGEIFYIIMEGEVMIKIPGPDVLEDEQCSAEGFLIFLIEYF